MGNENNGPIEKAKSYFDYLYEIEGDYLPLKLASEKSQKSYFKKKKKIKTDLVSEPAGIFDGKNSKGVDSDWINAKTLKELYDKIKNCEQCELHKGRTNLVFGAGNPNADIVIIGEAPGRDEDKQGVPFVGRAGKLLTELLASINFSRDEIYIANILKCRPPQNRKPLPSEEEKCEPFLKKQLEIMQPEFILALGLTAIDKLMNKKHRMADIRGSVLDYFGVKTFVTYHPAAILRNPNLKPAILEDFKMLKKLFDEYIENQKKGTGL